ncbi:ABC transporter permease [Corynebacterium qintianiae]|uniref:Transport permease protein n=1 Tax=Corynebacterium qintianiae TaxID=2709392 RepID=A0A7T0KLE6_9CORY|nr:ABC transporter permease [Corynebacterium qintianiae]QPK82775.1 ABC transporter permease [Corynebacterium qintianiae]
MSHNNEKVVIEANGLFRVEVRPTFSHYMRSAWRRRNFIVAEARSDAFSISRGNALGKFWIILDPLLQSSVYVIVFGLILDSVRGVENFVGFLIIGTTFFGIFSKGITSAAGMVQKANPLISTFKVSLLEVALASTYRQFLDGIVPMGVAILIALAFQLNETIPFQLGLIVPLYFLAHIFILGTQLWVARATAFLPDLKQLVSVGVRGLFFLSGVFFTVDRFDADPLLESIVKANPIYQFLDIARNCVLYGETIPLEQWLYVLVWAVILGLSGMLYAWRAEGIYASIK